MCCRASSPAGVSFWRAGCSLVSREQAPTEPPVPLGRECGDPSQQGRRQAEGSKGPLGTSSFVLGLRLAGDLPDLQDHELGRLQRSEADLDVHDPPIDVVLGRRVPSQRARSSRRVAMPPWRKRLCMKAQALSRIRAIGLVIRLEDGPLCPPVEALFEEESEPKGDRKQIYAAPPMAPEARAEQIEVRRYGRDSAEFSRVENLSDPKVPKEQNQRS
jgi:hypothetical protein